jgi:hypothetical protein
MGRVFGSARAFRGSAREKDRPSRAYFSGPLRAFGSPGSARVSPKAHCFFFLTKSGKATVENGLIFGP